MINKIRLILCLVIALAGLTIRANAQCFTNDPVLPPSDPDAAYRGEVVTYVIGTDTYVIDHISHTAFTDHFAPPLDVGTSTTHTFGSVLTGALSINGGSPFSFTAGATATVFVQKTSGPNGSVDGLYSTEMLQLVISGGTLPPNVIIRESPTLTSVGSTTITDIGGGEFRIDSFFDIFTELSVDGGASWAPSTGAGHVVLTCMPEPGSLAFLGLGVLGVVVRQRRRRQV